MKSIKQNPSFGEFIAMAALMMSLVALSTDSMLPAIAKIGEDLGAPAENANQLVISLFFLGLALGQLIYGPLSDSRGRRPAIFIGLSFYLVGSVLAMSAGNFLLMVIGRILQGMGAASPRIVTISLIRDQYAGRAMARVMAFIMAIFIVVPIVAPGVGQLILLIAHWRWIYGLLFILSLTTALWFGFRQPETLSADLRIPFTIRSMLKNIYLILTDRKSGGYTLTIGFVGGAFLGYLNSSQQVFQLQYGLGARFPIYFGVLAVFMGLASMLNARLLMRFGMRSLCRKAASVIILASIGYGYFAYGCEGHPPLWSLMIYFSVTFFCISFLFGNLNALAMEPLGRMAGIGATTVGAFSTLLNMLLGTVIGQFYNQTVIPLILGFLLCSSATLLLMFWIERKKP